MLNIPYDTVQGHADKDEAPSSPSEGSVRQEQKGCQRQSHRAPDIYILRISDIGSFSKRVAQKEP